MCCVCVLEVHTVHTECNTVARVCVSECVLGCVYRSIALYTMCVVSAYEYVTVSAWMLSSLLEETSTLSTSYFRAQFELRYVADRVLSPRGVKNGKHGVYSTVVFWP